MADVDGVEQLNAPAETGEREMKSKRRAAAEEEEATLVKAAMIVLVEFEKANNVACTMMAEVEKNL